MGKHLYETLRSLYKAFFVYKSGFPYLYYRYYIAPKIFRAGVLERPVTNPDLSMHMLTSHRDMLIACWSLASLYKNWQAIGNLTIHNDGTLTARDKKILSKLFPSARIVNVRDFFDKFRNQLSAYPVLEKFRLEYPKFQSKKLLDVYFESQGDIILYLDSDLLWFRNPEEVMEAINNGVRGKSLMMGNMKGNEAYVTMKDGTRISKEVASCNSGIVFFRKEDYDLEAVSDYVNSMDYMHSLFTDQACFGTVLPNVSILPLNKYFIKGELKDDTVMRHYTGPSREKFFFYGLDRIWKKILRQHV